MAKAKEATLAAIAQGADIHYHILNLGLRGMEQAAKDKGTHIIGSYTDRCGTDPLYVAYSITGVGFQVEYAIDQAVAGEWKPGYKEFGLKMGPQASDMIICNGTPEQKAKLEAIKKDILAGKIKVLEGLSPPEACIKKPAGTIAVTIAPNHGRTAAGAHGVTKRFGALVALADASLDIMPGEVHCILGENGAGKSTLCNLIFGVHVPDAGAMRFRGETYRPSGPSDALSTASPWCTSISAWCTT